MVTAPCERESSGQSTSWCSEKERGGLVGLYHGQRILGSIFAAKDIANKLLNERMNAVYAFVFANVIAKN